MNYHCPNCGTVMAGIFCECTMVAAIHLFRNPDGKMYHRCGKPLSPENQRGWEKFMEEERDKHAKEAGK